jgi:tripartite-type tricarboxylate transporter receptor subunit TctC
VNEVSGDPAVQFDSSEFRWLGSPSGGTPVCTFMADSGIKTIDDWMKAETPPKIGSTAPSADVVFSAPKLLQTQTELPMQIIVGHQGGNPALKLAAKRGEIDGFCASLEATTIVLAEELASGEANVVVQFGEEPDPAIPDVPLASALVTTDDGIGLIRAAVTGPAQLNRVFAFPPGTPDEIVDTMRKSLVETFGDPAFIADAKQVNVNVNPADGEEATKIIQQIGELSPEAGEKLRGILSAN